MEEIGLFQLENLTISRSPFVFLDLRSETASELPKQIADCLKQAQPVAPAEVKNHLEVKLKVPKEYPVLLVSEDGKSCAKVARDLETAGFTNIYVIMDGVEGLLSELRT